MKKTQNLATVPNYDFEPFCVLEGQKGLNDTERYFIRSCNEWNYENWVLDDLYENHRKLMAVFFLRPKTIILGTTGIYREKLDALTDLFFSYESDFSWLENIIFTLDSEGIFRSEIKKIKELNSNIKFWDFYEDPSLFDVKGTKYGIREIKL